MIFKRAAKIKINLYQSLCVSIMIWTSFDSLWSPGRIIHSRPLLCMANLILGENKKIFLLSYEIPHLKSVCYQGFIGDPGALQLFIRYCVDFCTLITAFNEAIRIGS